MVVSIFNFFLDKIQKFKFSLDYRDEFEEIFNQQQKKVNYSSTAAHCQIIELNILFNINIIQSTSICLQETEKQNPSKLIPIHHSWWSINTIFFFNLKYVTIFVCFHVFLFLKFYSFSYQRWRTYTHFIT